LNPEPTYLERSALRSDAEDLSSALPPLMAEAERLAASVILGEHGRRRAGMGESFWQYRRAEAGDDFAAIDWRRSARSDRLYIRQTEWEVAQSVALWVDPSKAMSFKSAQAKFSKGERAQLLALALAVALNRGGERFSLIGSPADRPRRGRHQLELMASGLLSADDSEDYGNVPPSQMAQGSRAVFFSDFLGGRDALIAQIGQAADRGVRGLIVQVLDPAEEVFPYDGRTIFKSMGGGLKYETDRAKSLREAYLDKLADLKSELKDLARTTGWFYYGHRTDEAPRAAMLWLFAALEGFRT
jgi:uncharacterized protein (DUF58 family)